MSKNYYKFDVEFMEEALYFLQSLDSKTTEKILENIRISRIKIDPRLLKKIDKDIWEFRTMDFLRIVDSKIS